jgi:hypothetical protein
VSLAKPALSLGRGAVSLVVTLGTIAVLVLLLLLEGPKMRQGILGLMAPERTRRYARVAHEINQSVTGYMVGDILTSVIAGVVVFFTLLALGIPFPLLWALWVALVDFLPQVGWWLLRQLCGGVAFHSRRRRPADSRQGTVASYRSGRAARRRTSGRQRRASIPGRRHARCQGAPVAEHSPQRAKSLTRPRRCGGVIRPGPPLSRSPDPSVKGCHCLPKDGVAHGALIHCRELNLAPHSAYVHLDQCRFGGS